MSTGVPNPLWTKDKSTGIYVDIFSEDYHQLETDGVLKEVNDLFNNRERKDDAKAKGYRIQGNEFFVEGMYHIALEKYNRSMCYSNSYSYDMALSISNRSACYLKMKLYNECLKDIERVRNSNYPPNMKEKLDVREAECMKGITATNQQRVRIDSEKAILSFPEHQQYAGVADCLEIQQNVEWGRHITTTRNLKIGQTLMVEEPFSFIGHDCNDLKYYRCSHCYRRLQNFIPCNKCVYSMFCDEQCLVAATKNRHKFECNIMKPETVECECREKQVQLVLDVLWRINSTFDTVDELIRTVEMMIHGDSGASSTDESDPNKAATLKNLEKILQMETNKDRQGEKEFTRMMYFSLKNFFVVMRMREFNERFVSTAQIHFLKHLIFHLAHTAQQSTCFNDLTLDLGRFRDLQIRDYGIGLYPIGGLFNHSCVPNIYCYSVDNRFICKVIRPIKRGEQLFRSYICGQLVIEDDDTVDNSYSFLKTEFSIDVCRCSYCMRRSTRQPLTNMWFQTNDQSYAKIREILEGNIDDFFQMPDEEREAYVKSAFAFLLKYESIHPIHEIFTVQMFLHNYWMLTTSARE